MNTAPQAALPEREVDEVDVCIVGGGMHDPPSQM